MHSGHLAINEEMGVAYLTVRPWAKISHQVPATTWGVVMDVDEDGKLVGVEILNWPGCGDEASKKGGAS